MFFSLLALLASPIFALAVEKRQGSPLDLSALLNEIEPIEAASITTIEPEIDPEATRHSVRYGPITLPANTGDVKAESHSHMAPMSSLDIFLGKAAMDPFGITIARKPVSGICANCTILGGQINVVFPNGTRADISTGLYLHHVTIMDMTKQVPAVIGFCPGDEATTRTAGVGGLGQTVLGGSVDAFNELYQSPVDKDLKSGYQVGEDWKFLMQAEMINYRPEQHDVFIEVQIEYLDGLVGQDTVKAVLSATGCMGSGDGDGDAWTSGSNKTGEISVEGYPVLRDGTIIVERGHVHDGGVKVVLSVNGEVACTSEATYGGPGGTLVLDGVKWETISHMHQCLEPVHVKKGDKITVSGSYDTVQHPLRESHGEEQENMLMMTLNFVPDPES